MKNFLIKEDYRDELPPVNPAEVAPVEYSKNLSLDELVDRYLLQYEQEATGKGTPKIQESSWKDDFKKFMNEAPGDDAAAGLGGEVLGGDPAAGGGDPGLGLGDPTGGAPAAPAAPAAPNILPPDIDIERYAELIYGLMQNYETLIDPKNTIMNRAEAFIAKNYSPRHAEKLTTFLKTKYGIGFKDRARDMEDKFAAGSFGDAGSSVSAAPS